MKKIISNNNAFTLIELLIVTAITGFILMGVSTAFVTASKTERAQSDMVTLQQNMRNTINYMSYFIRLAGVDPNETGSFGFTDNIVGSVDPEGNTDNAFTNNTGIAFDYDDNENGLMNVGERTGFRINGTELQQMIFDGNSYIWESLISNVEVLDFVYLDEDNAVLPNPAAALKDIRSIEMTLVVRNENPSTNYVDRKIYENKQKINLYPDGYDTRFKRKKTTTTIKTRNLSY